MAFDTPNEPSVTGKMLNSISRLLTNYGSTPWLIMDMVALPQTAPFAIPYRNERLYFKLQTIQLESIERYVLLTLKLEMPLLET